MLKYLVKPPQNKRKAEEKLHDQKSSLRPETKKKANRGSKGDSLDIDVDAGDNATSLGGFEEQASTQTELDLALPPLPDDEIIKQESTYEQDSRELSTKERIEQRRWVKGKSSLYVDAFNLALDSVLEKESFLFDDAELALFDHWRALSYGTQYLYVRLFLRKAAAWHRVDQLAYHNDIDDLPAALSELRQARDLPEKPPSSHFEVFKDDNPPIETSFQFAQGIESIETLEEASSLLLLPELKAIAKEQNAKGRNKAELIKALRAQSTNQSGIQCEAAKASGSDTVGIDISQSNRDAYLIRKILASTGDCVRLSQSPFKLFERVHLIFYRSTEWTERSLTAIILARASRRNFPKYLVICSGPIFTSRGILREFESALRVQYEVDGLVEFNKDDPEKRFGRVKELADAVFPRWKELIAEEEHKEEHEYLMGEGAYLRRFSPAWVYTRILHKGLLAYARFKDYKREYEVLTELLSQSLLHVARRGAWYQRKALLEEHYMWEFFPRDGKPDDCLKKQWKRTALQTAELGLQDPQTHIIYHYGLQKRIMKLEKMLRVVKREQHDFGHVMLSKPFERVVEGVRIEDELSPLMQADPLTRKGKATVWVDEVEGGECRVETMCLHWYESQGWKGFHSEGGIVRTLFAYLFYDILFASVPNVFQTEYQTCPLDLHTDAFYPSRASEINHRLVEISNGESASLIQSVHDSEFERKTCIVGLDWSYELSDLLQIVDCFRGEALATICKVMAQEYQQRGGGIPDLFLWNVKEKEVMFVEVKSENDRLSDKQRLWIHVLTACGTRVELCHAVAKQVLTKRDGDDGRLDTMFALDKK